MGGSAFVVFHFAYDSSAKLPWHLCPKLDFIGSSKVTPLWNAIWPANR